MITKDKNSAEHPENNFIPGCSARDDATHLEDVRFLAGELWRIRETSTLGGRVAAAQILGFNNNTIASYERGLTLPDIDYLVVFADRTGADLGELLRLRLRASRYEKVRALADRITLEIVPVPAPEPAERPPEPVQAFDSQRDMLEAILRVGEYKIIHNQVTPQMVETVLAAAAHWHAAAASYPDLAGRFQSMTASYQFLGTIGAPSI